MMIVASQVHAYERDHPGRPWVSVLPGPPSATGDEMVAAMSVAGADGAFLVSLSRCIARTLRCVYRWTPSKNP